MGARKSPLPIYRADRFELAGKEDALRELIPLHHNRVPREEERDPALWAVEGILTPTEPEHRVLLAINIGDVEIPHPHPTKDKDTLTITGDTIAAMFVSARMGRLAAEFPDMDVLSGSEVHMMLPRAAVTPLYREGMSVPPESVFPEPPMVSQPAGRVAAGGAGIIPSPIPQAA